MGRTAKGLVAVLAVVGVFGALLALSVLGTAPETPLPGISLGPQDGALLLAAEGEDGPYIACSQESGSTVTALNTATEDAARVALSHPLLGAAYRGTHVVFFAEEYGFLRVGVFTGGLELLRDEFSPCLADELFLYDATAEGCLYAVLQEDSATLCFYDMQGGEWERTFDSPIRLLQITEQGQLWVCTTAGSCYAGDAQNPDSLRLIPGGQPQRILGSNIFIDSSGQLWRVTGESSEPVLPGLPANSLCSAGSNGVVYADDTGRLRQILWDGTEQGSCFTAGEPLALTAKGVLYQQDGALYYALLDFTPPQDEPLSPSPEPTEPPAPSLEPEPSLEPIPSLEPYPSWLDLREGYIYITGEVPIESLINELQPDVVCIAAASGEPLPENVLHTGTLATGMQASWGQDGTETTEPIEARIIVWGDCDGNGKITKADMEQAQLMLLQGRGAAEDYSYLAADRDEDGEITAQDLLWLSAELETLD